MLVKTEETPKEHIERLYREKANNDINSATLARSLLKDINTAFKGGQKFLFELLQNADDAADEAIAVSFNIVYINEACYLLFSHEGKHFNEIDVNKICDFAQQEHHDKSENPNKIGYKGIGFKAIFSIADSVHILSDKYRFCFDKTHTLWQNNSECYPWPIIPIWRESPMNLGENVIDESKVNFLLRIKQNVDIHKELRVFSNNPAVLLFLRNVKKITLPETVIKLKQNNYKKEIFYNKSLQSTWICHDFDFLLLPETKAALKEFGNEECPLRLKAATHTRITFAVGVDSAGKFIPKNSPIFCYLPTQVNCGLPYYVNADFLLNADRMGLIENFWNAKLFYVIGQMQFAWFAKLCQFSEFRYQILHLLCEGINMDKQLSDLKLEFARGFQEGLASVPFIPAYQSDTLLLKSKATVDRTKFFKALQVPYQDLVDHRVKSKRYKLIERLKVPTIEIVQLCQIINHNDISQYIRPIEVQKKIIKFFAKKLKNHSQWRPDVLSTRFLLRENMELDCPENLYLSVAGFYQLY